MLDSAPGVQHALCRDVCCVRFFGSLEQPKVDHFSFSADSCSPPFVVVPMGAEKPAGAVSSWSALVLCVDAFAGNTKIRNSVVFFVSVDVVNVSVRPLSVTKEPSKSVSKIALAKRSNAPVSCQVTIAAYKKISPVSNDVTLRKTFKTSKRTGRWAVTETPLEGREIIH